MSKRFLVLVCGGRTFNDYGIVMATLSEILREHPGMEIVHGAASGADSLAQAWAVESRVRATKFPAEWKRYGKMAGAIRNQAMLAAGPDLVVAFPGGPGTADMCRRARDAGVRVMVVS